MTIGTLETNVGLVPGLNLTGFNIFFLFYIGFEFVINEKMNTVYKILKD